MIRGGHGRVVDRVNGQVQVQRAVGIGGTEGVVAIGRGFVLNPLASIAHSVLSIHREAGKRRGLVGNHVVPGTGADREGAGLSRVVGKARAEGRDHAVLGPGALTAVERTHLAEGDLTEAAFEEQARFTIEEHAAVVASVGVKAVFENEADRQAVAEVFRALQAEARTGSHAGLHLEGIRGVDVGHIGVDVGIQKARINDTVELNVSGQSRAGKRAESGDSSQSLFHVKSPSL